MISPEARAPGPTDHNKSNQVSDDAADDADGRNQHLVTVSNDLDKVIKLVEEEGREARNLLTWNVPISISECSPPSSKNFTSDSSLTEGKKMKKPPLSPRGCILTHRSHLLGTIDAYTGRPLKRFSYDKAKVLRIRSASAERDPKHDLSARYWAFLFENLQRAVDAIYQTCDTDESIIECKETIMMLENYIKEFTSLIEWLNLNRNFENAAPAEKPTSLVWEVKKSSLTRSLPLSPTLDKKLNKALGSPCKRKLVFTSTSESCTQTGEQIDEAVKEVNNVSSKDSSLTQKVASTSDVTSKEKTSVLLNSAKPVTDLKKKTTLLKPSTNSVTQNKKIPSNVSQRVQSPTFANKQRIVSARKVLKPTKSIDDKVVPDSASQKVTKDKISLSSQSLASISLRSEQNIDQKTGSSSSLSSTSSNGRSWADKVKGTAQIAPISESDIKSESTNIVNDDNDGWETVSRGKNKLRTPPPSALSNKSKNFSKHHSSEYLNHSNLGHGSRNFRRRSKQFNTKVSNEGQRKTLNNRCLKDQTLTVKSMPSLNRRTKNETQCNNVKKSASQMVTSDPDVNIKTKSLPDVTEASKLSTDTMKVAMNEKENECDKNHSLKDGIVDVTLENASNGELLRVNENEEQMYDMSQEDQAELMQLDASLELINEQERSLMIENAKDNEDMISLLESGLEPKIDQVDSYSVKSEMDANKIKNWAELVSEHEEEMNAAATGDISWSDTTEQMELRQPGRGLQMHEKLSSPSRKRSLSETIRRQEEKQAKAQEQRERILEEKAQKLRDQSKKIEEVRAWKEELLLKRKGTIERKLEKAEQKRKKQIQLVVKKAHDEEEKVNEIAFINTLEAQNKRLDVLSRHKDHEARLQDIQEERQRRLEEKAAKEVAAEERRKALEVERVSRLQEMQEKRKKRDMKIEQQLQEKEKERLEQAREKAREREQRLSALTAAQNANAEELQRKIKLKQEESARRHEENIEQKRLKAFELSVRKYSSTNDDAPRLVPYDMVKLCTLCNVLISSEVYLLSHLRGKTHREAVKEKHEGKELVIDEMEAFNLKLIIDAPADKVDPRIVQDKERQKALKKRCKKIRHRMMLRATEYENLTANKTQQVESQNKAKLARCVKEINKCIQNQGTGAWSSNQISALERSLGEVNRALDKKLVSDQIAFRILGGLIGLMKLLNLISSESKDTAVVTVPPRILIHVCTVFKLACLCCRFNCNYVLYSNLITNMIDLTTHKLNSLMTSHESPSRNSPTLNVNVSYISDAVTGNLMEVVAVVLSCLAHQSELTEVKDTEENGFQLRARDVVSYVVSIGIIDKIYEYFKTIQGPIDNDPEVAEFLHQCVMLLTGVVKLLSNKCQNAFESKKSDDVTQLIPTLAMTEIVGSVSMLYGILLHSGAASPEGGMPPPELPHLTTTVALSVLQMLNHVAILDLNLYQNVLGSEGTSLEFRHISSYLMWYCSHWPNEDLLHEVIVLIGYFTVLNNDNQIFLQSGHYPTVLQQLCALPFNYFSDPMLTTILFPTLISCCHGNSDNKDILEQDMSSSLLANFIEAQQLSILQADLMPSKTMTIDERWTLQNRFPGDHWNEACEFLNSGSPC